MEHLAMFLLASQCTCVGTMGISSSEMQTNPLNVLLNKKYYTLLE